MLTKFLVIWSIENVPRPIPQENDILVDIYIYLLHNIFKEDYSNLINEEVSMFWQDNF